MMKPFCIAIALLFCGCSSNSYLATLQSDSLVAGTIPINASMGLTKEDKSRLERHYPKTLEKIEKHHRLNLQDIKNLTRIGASDDVIIYEISSTRSFFFLTPDDEEELQQAGVSNRVIDAMKDTIQDQY